MNKIVLTKEQEKDLIMAAFSTKTTSYKALSKKFGYSEITCKRLVNEAAINLLQNMKKVADTSKIDYDGIIDLCLNNSDFVKAYSKGIGYPEEVLMNVVNYASKQINVIHASPAIQVPSEETKNEPEPTTPEPEVATDEGTTDNAPSMVIAIGNDGLHLQFPDGKMTKNFVDMLSQHMRRITPNEETMTFHADLDACRVDIMNIMWNETIFTCIDLYTKVLMNEPKPTTSEPEVATDEKKDGSYSFKMNYSPNTPLSLRAIYKLAKRVVGKYNLDSCPFIIDNTDKNGSVNYVVVIKYILGEADNTGYTVYAIHVGYGKEMLEKIITTISIGN